MSDSSDSDVTPSASVDGAIRHRQDDYLSLINLPALARIEFALRSGRQPTLPGYAVESISMTGQILGTGGSFTVRRVPRRNLPHMPPNVFDRLWPEKGDEGGEASEDSNTATRPEADPPAFVAVKQPLLAPEESPRANEFRRRLHAAMLELSILSHQGIKRHPNIVRLLHYGWDTQDHARALAPSLVLEYAELGALGDFQDARWLMLSATAKREVCADVARGLAYLHRCGIIHGDVKSENVLLFRKWTGNSSRAWTIQAKISDFGSSLIEVVENGVKQALTGRTEPWDAPDPETPMDALALRRTDVYSFGLLVWRVMCNGAPPYTFLYWEAKPCKVTTRPAVTGQKCLTKKDFQRFKREADGEPLLDAAIDTLRDRPVGDVPFTAAQRVLELTLPLDPCDRIKDLDEVATILDQQHPDSAKRTSATRPLMRGDFSIHSYLFPSLVYVLRTTPPSFRALIIDQLGRNARSARTRATKAASWLAVAVCYALGLATHAEIEVGGTVQMCNDALAQSLARKALLRAAKLGNPVAQSLVPAILQSQGLAARMGDYPWADWLVSSMRCGSLRASSELRRRLRARWDEAVMAIWLMRKEVASTMRADSNEPLPASFFKQFPGLDAAARAALTQDGQARLHQAAYLGSADVCASLLQRDGGSSTAKTVAGETPLHFAAKGGQVSTLELILGAGVDVNVQTADGATPLHYATCSFEPARVVFVLLKHGANPNIISGYALQEMPDYHDYFMRPGSSPLQIAVCRQDYETAEMLLNAGASPNLRYTSGDPTPLESALRIRSLPMVELLLPYATQHVSDLPNVHELYQFLSGFLLSPLEKKINWLNIDSVDFILQVTEAFRARGIDFDDRALLLWAQDCNDAALMECILGRLTVAKSAAPLLPYRWRCDGHQTVDTNAASDLHVLLRNAVIGCTPDVIKVVLEHMERPIVSSTGEPTAAIFLAWRLMTTLTEACKIAALLAEAGIDMGARDAYGVGPVSHAVLHHNFDAVEALLGQNPDIDDVIQAMHRVGLHAGRHPAGRMMRSVFSKLPDLFSPETPPETGGLWALHTTVGIGKPNSNFLSTLCETWEAGRDDAAYASLFSDLIQRIKLGRGGSAVLEAMLTQHNNPYVMYTPLHTAVAMGNRAAVGVLLEEGADVNHSGEPAADSMLDLASILGDLANLDGGLGLEALQLVANEATAPIWRRGPTPLDVAHERDWVMMLHAAPPPERAALLELWMLGGLHREERKFQHRTDEVARLLRQWGAKTKSELFHLTAPTEDLRDRPGPQRVSPKENFLASHTPKPRSGEKTRVVEYLTRAYSWPSAELAQAAYPNLLTRTATSSEIEGVFRDAAGKFRHLLETRDWLAVESPLRAAVERAGTVFTAWGERNCVVDGGFDSVQTDSPLLAAGVLMNLFEIRRVLELVEELVTSESRGKDYPMRCKELQLDLNLATGALNSEEGILKELAAAAS